MKTLIRISNRKDSKLFKIVDIEQMNRNQWENFKKAYFKNPYFEVTSERNK